MPLPLLAIPAILGGAQTLVGAIGGLLNKRPNYEIPSAAKQSFALAQLQAASSLPGYAQAKSNIGATTGNLINAAKESGNPTAILSAIQANQNKASNDLDVQNANYQTQMQQNLQNAANEYANFEDQKFQLNKYQPYVDRKNQFSDLLGSGINNVIGGLQTMELMRMMGGTNNVDTKVIERDSKVTPPLARMNKSSLPPIPKYKKT